MRFRRSPLKTFKNNRIARCDISWTLRMLQTHAPAIFSIIVFTLMLFRPSSTVNTNTICMRFRFDHLSRAFSNRCDAFSMKTLSVLVRTKGLNASKRMRFQTKTHQWTGPKLSACSSAHQAFFLSANVVP